MRLCRVRLSGFKTFATRTEAALDPGVTAVVGPNGSGKSNLVDAIRWALGETNARDLRGARMDEVIYSGRGGPVGAGGATRGRPAPPPRRARRAGAAARRARVAGRGRTRAAPPGGPSRRAAGQPGP